MNDSNIKTHVSVGNGNYLDSGARVFYPREDDWCTIARTILYMRRWWDFDLDRATDATVAELIRIAHTRCVRLDELWQMRIARRLKNTTKDCV